MSAGRRRVRPTRRRSALNAVGRDDRGHPLNVDGGRLGKVNSIQFYFGFLEFFSCANPLTMPAVASPIFVMISS